MATIQNPTTTLTWQELVQREPRLAVLEAAVSRADRGGPEFNGLDVWYRKFKPVMTTLVGTFAQTDDEVLGSVDAYDITYSHLCFDVLPPDRQGHE